MICTVVNQSPDPVMTPSFREFLPSWVSRQRWYRGNGVPRLALAGAFRLEDPAGEVGMETHLLADGETIYHVPMTYRGAPLPGGPADALIAQAEHSVLGTRWIYDAERDPVWQREVVRLVEDCGSLRLRGPGGVIPDAVVARAINPRRLQGGSSEKIGIDLYRVLTAAQPAEVPGENMAGLVSVSLPQVVARLVLVR